MLDEVMKNIPFILATPAPMEQDDSAETSVVERLDAVSA